MVVLFYLYIPIQVLPAIGIVVVLLLMFLMSVSLGFALATLSSDIVPELCVHEAADDLVLNIGPCLLHNKPDPVAVEIFWHIFLLPHMPPSWPRTLEGF